MFVVDQKEYIAWLTVRKKTSIQVSGMKGFAKRLFALMKAQSLRY